MDPIAAMDRDGFVVLRGTFAVGLIEALAAAYAGLLEEEPPGMRVGDRRVQLPVPVRPPFSDEALVTRLLPLLATLLGPSLLVASYGSVVAWPGAAAQHVHRDHDLLFPWPLGGELPCHAVTLVVPLVDLDDSTGTTALYPGTHRAASPDGVAPELPRLARGDCYLMDYRIFHGGTANPGTRPRPLLYIVYSRPWFVDMVNFVDVRPLVLAAADLAGMPDRARRLFRRAAMP